MCQAIAQIKQNHLKGDTGGLVAVCSAHPLVLRTAMEMALERQRPLLVEATANQVNQFGGYTGMAPVQFAALVTRLATEVGLGREQVMIGADHLGPHVWKNEPAAAAMAKAEALVRQCVRAGFHKIHLDTGTGCLDDPGPPLPLDQTVQRAAVLCRTVEALAGEKGPDGRPFYVIGNEVPTPGGGLDRDQGVALTDPDQLFPVLADYERAFRGLNLESAWQRVMAVVVQPGADFGDREVAVYRPERAGALSAAYDRLPGMVIYEIHATDYQPREALRQLVRDHFPLLKVGPALTFAMRRALYGLARIEAQLPGIGLASNLVEVMERLMITRPKYWQSHYKGSADAVKTLRHESLRDRIRYYWSFPEACNAVERLIENLQQPLPETLLRQHLPDMCTDIEQAGLNGDPTAMVQLSIRKALDPYWDACR